MTKNEQGFITSLEENEYFVFGSNTAGRHGAGAALQAKQQFGAEYGVGVGPTGQCFAFPTLDDRLQKLPVMELVAYREFFRHYAFEHPELTFYVTKLGCGLAGFPEALMRWVLIEGASDPMPRNVIMPEGW